MPMQQGKSSLTSKIKPSAQEALRKNRDIPPIGDTGGSLPAGIENGIAKLVDVHFGVYKEGKHVGEYFFMAAGIVVKPIEHDGVPIEGQRTQIGPEAVCDTLESTGKRKTQTDHLLWIQDQLKMLGASGPQVETGSLEATAASLTKMSTTPVEQGGSPIYFRFRTWKGKKATTGPYKDQEPRVQHVWGGLINLKADQGGVSTNGVVDNTPSANGEANTLGNPDDFPDQAATSTEQTPDGGEVPEGQDEITLEELVAMAGGSPDDPNTEAAGNQLTDLAKEVGVDEATIESAQNWQEVADLITAAQSESEGKSETEVAAEQQWSPKVGEAYRYQANDPKTKKPAINTKTKKPLLSDVEILEVDEKAQTVTLKNLTNTKIKYSKVPWASLQSGE